jgi:ribulose-phosphate 3-epimerase
MISIAPSILAADFARLGEQVLETERAGANRIHIDVMDGHFVPNLTMGPLVVQALRPITRLPLEVHLMIEAPARFADAFLKAGADRLIVHHEVLPDPMPLLHHIRGAGKQVGMAVNPETPVEVLEPVLTQVDLALCMTVHPGFGGQAFLPESPERIRRLRALIERLHPACELEVDGGIELHTAPTAIAAGANVLVVGTGIFRAKNGPTAAIHALRTLAQQSGA